MQLVDQRPRHDSRLNPRNEDVWRAGKLAPCERVGTTDLGSGYDEWDGGLLEGQARRDAEPPSLSFNSVNSTRGDHNDVLLPPS